MLQHYDVLIVGAGHGGAQAALSLRQTEFKGTIAIMGEEPEIPYERPPLSKEYLAGDKSFERILIRPASFWSDRAIDMLTERRVIAVDPVGHCVTIAGGNTITYGQMIWATGGSPRRLTCFGAKSQGIHSIRNRADIVALTARLPMTNKVIVIGGGYIGLEAAAVLTKLGKQVVVLEAMERVLARVAGKVLSRFYETEHRAHGVDLRTSTTIESIEVEEGRACGVKLANGSIISADMIIVGIGIIPGTAPLVEAGAKGENGVDVDEYCRTSLPDIYAIGDCAAHKNKYAQGNKIRLESVQNATDQAKVAAQHIAGQVRIYHAIPWFWSNQYDLRLQTVGLSGGHDLAVLRGDVSKRSFSVIYIREGRIIALDCVNAVKDYVQGRALVIAGAKIAVGSLADTKKSLKGLLST